MHAYIDRGPSNASVTGHQVSTYWPQQLTGSTRTTYRQLVIRGLCMNTREAILLPGIDSNTDLIHTMTQYCAVVISIHEYMICPSQWRHNERHAVSITSISTVCLTVYSGAYERKRQSSAKLAFVRRINRWPVDSPDKGPVARVSVWWRYHVTSTGYLRKFVLTYGCRANLVIIVSG